MFEEKCALKYIQSARRSASKASGMFEEKCALKYIQSARASAPPIISYAQNVKEKLISAAEARKGGAALQVMIRVATEIKNTQAARRLIESKVKDNHVARGSFPPILSYAQKVKEKLIRQTIGEK